MKARGGFTLVELMLAGAILGMLAFGAIKGIAHLAIYVNRRGELLAADEFCWDLAWKLFNDDESDLQRLMSMTEEEVAALKAGGYDYPYPGRPSIGPAYLEVKGTLCKPHTGNWNSDYSFLSDLPAFEENPPVCYVIMSNRCENGVYQDDGVFISVNLEWGPRGRRRYLMPRPETTKEDREAGRVFNHNISVFRSYLSRSPIE